MRLPEVWPPIGIMPHRPWQLVAGVLFGVQLLLFLVGLGEDRFWFPQTSQGFFLGMALHGVLVGLDAMLSGFGLKRSAVWATIVTIGWILGAIPYARRRQQRLAQG